MLLPSSLPGLRIFFAAWLGPLERRDSQLFLLTLAGRDLVNLVGFSYFELFTFLFRELLSRIDVSTLFQSLGKLLHNRTQNE